MEEAEKMAALKKAYADIILNTAKESASRILASERKALRFQHALFLAKEEALSTLLRLKTVMDSKVKEAERVALGQVRRIQELEVQLVEAEDAVNYLKTELKRVNDELEKMKNNFAEPLDEQNTNGHATCYVDKHQENKLTPDFELCYPAGPEHISASVFKDTTLNQRTEDGYCRSIEIAAQAEPLDDLAAENKCASNPDLTSIIMRSKEPELYRNGCTQRIRAFEQNLLTGKVPLGQSDDQFLNLKNEMIVSGNEKVEGLSTIDSAKANSKVVQAKGASGSKERVHQASSCENGQVVKFFRRHSSRKRRANCKYLKSTNCDNSPDQEKADHEPSDIHCFKTFGRDNVTKSSETPSEAISEESNKNSCFIPISNGSCKTSDFDTNLTISLKSENQVSLKSNKRTLTRHTVRKGSHMDSKNQMLNVGCENIERDPLPLSTIDDNDVALLTGNVEGDSGNNLSVEESMLTRPVQEVAEGSDISICKVNLKTGDVPLTNSDPKDEKGCEPSVTHGQAASDRYLMYTFRRKRKRDPSTTRNETVFPEKNITSTRRTADTQNALPEPQKPSLVVDSSRQSRRLVQVARQLISLSEKKWW